MMAADTREELFDTATAAASGLLGFEYNTIREYDRDDDTLVPVASSPQLRQAGGDRRIYERGETVQWDAFDAGELTVFQDVTAIDDGVDRTGEGSMIVVPLGDYGVLTLGSSDRQLITTTDADLARVFGANVETAIDRLEHIRTLREHETQLEAKTERLDRFAEKVSHELRNPLNVLAGRLERVRATGNPDHLDHLEQSINRMDRLIDDILTLSRTGEVDIEPEPIELRALATDSWDAVRTPETRLDIESSSVVAADADRVRQVFENLFRNAAEHAGPDVTVSVGVFDDGFYIEDDGCGIDETQQDRLVAVGESGDVWSAGLGLAVVSEVVELHGWSLTVTDSATGGARFEFRGVTE